MKKTLKNDLSQMTLEELANRAQDLRKELFLLRMKKVATPEKNTALERNLRKGLACALTFLKQKELHGE